MGRAAPLVALAACGCLWSATNAAKTTLEQEVITLGSSVDALRAQDLGFLKRLVGESRMVGFGEAKHELHEMLILRNRIFEYLVENLGFTALAAESGFTDGTLVDDYVTGSAQVGREQAARGVFTFTPEAFAENRALIDWMRDYNSRPTTQRKIRFYGLDMMGRAGSKRGNPFARKACDAALSYLESASPQDAARFRLKLDPTLARIVDDSYERLSDREKDTFTASLADFVALFERRHVDWAQKSGALLYHRAYRNALNARGIDADLRARGWWSSQLVDINQRDAELAEHLRWVSDREGPQGKVLAFAHVGHLRKAPSVDSAGQRWFTSMGEHLSETQGDAFVVIGSVYAPASGVRTAVMDDDWEAVDEGNRTLARLGSPLFALDFRSARIAGQPVPDPGPLSYNPGKHFTLDGPRSFDALIFVDGISAAQATSASLER